MKPVLRIEDLSRSFGSNRAVSDLSFTVEPGEIYGLIGPDGAGKTTTLRMLIGAITPERGNTFIQEVSVEDSPERARERIGYMPQAYGLYQDLTVEENLKFYGDLQGVPTIGLKKRITELLEFIRLESFRKRRVGDLSGGMYKKLAVACAMIHSPPILILDEPTNGVDPVSRRDLWALLFGLANDGVSILVSTPYMDEAERCHRVGLIMNGRLIQEGDPKKLTESITGSLFSLKCDHPGTALKQLKELDPEILAFQAGTELRIFLEKGNLPPSLKEMIRAGACSRPEPVTPVFEDVFMQQILKGAHT